jgi:hypothetical protein
MSFPGLPFRENDGIAQKSLWFGKNLGDAMLTWEQLDHIENLSASVNGKAKRRQNAAVFYRHESEGRLHCEVCAYFSPAAVELARAAVPCEQPSQDSLSLLVGSEDSWTAFFPVHPD